MIKRWLIEHPRLESIVVEADSVEYAAQRGAEQIGIDNFTPRPVILTVTELAEESTNYRVGITNPVYEVNPVVKGLAKI